MFFQANLSSSDLVLLRLLGVNLSGSGFMNRELVCKALERVIQCSDKRSELLVVFLVKMALAHGHLMGIKRVRAVSETLLPFLLLLNTKTVIVH